MFFDVLYVLVIEKVLIQDFFSLKCKFRAMISEKNSEKKLLQNDIKY